MTLVTVPSPGAGDAGPVLGALLSVFAPPLCVACGDDAGRAAPLCRACRAELARTACATPVDGALGVWAPFRYDGPAGAVVRALKFGGRRGLADVMAAQLAAHAPPELLAGALVPVPLPRSRRRRRGFNQSALLARALGRRGGLPVVDCLTRSGDPAPQVGRGRRERMAAPAGSFAVSGPPPERALLVDDVVTTGSTLRACAQALRDAGCGPVWALAYARTPAR